VADEALRALVVEDDTANRLLLRRFLEREGYEVAEAADGPAALRAVLASSPDVVVLDLGLPGLDGLDVLARVRADSGLPILVLTGRDDDDAVLEGLDAGADDYMVKPFSLPELAARLRALLRRGQAVPRRTVVRVGPLTIDLDGARADYAGEPLALTARELGLLAFLARSPGRCFSRAELLEHVWGSTDEWQAAATVTEHVRRVRRKLGDRGADWIETVRGRGYRFAADPSVLAADT